MRKVNLLSLVGLAGVNPDERKVARVWGKAFNYIVVAVAIVLLIQWQAELLHQLTPIHRILINVSIWSYFVIEMGILLVLVKDRLRFLRQNWMLPIIIILGLPIITQHVEAITLLRGLRPLLALVILLPAIQILGRFFADGQLRTTLMAAAIIIIIFGLLVAGVDPSIHSAWDGIWWAVATVSTVGYGDVVPTSPLGRLIGVGLIVLGLGIFVTITANFLALILRKEVVEVKEKEKELEVILESLKESQENQLDTNELLESLSDRIKKLEKKIEKQQK